MKANSFFLSIIIPVFNLPIEITKRAVWSIKGKHIDDIEIILVDDGSNYEIAKEIDDAFGTDGRIKVIHKLNGGVSNARNEGIKISSGKYISFLDGDDIVSRNFVDEAYYYSNKYNADMIIGGFFEEEKSREYISHDVQIVTDNVELEMMKSIHGIVPRRINRRVEGTACGILFNKKVLLGIDFDESVHICEDQLFIREVLHNVSSVILLGSLWYYYGYRNDSAMHSYFEKSLLDRMNPYLDGLFKYAQKANEDVRDYIFLDIMDVYGAIIQNDCLSNPELIGWSKVKGFRKLVGNNRLRVATHSVYKSKSVMMLKKKLAAFLLSNQLSMIYYLYQRISCIKRKTKDPLV